MHGSWMHIIGNMWFLRVFGAYIVLYPRVKVHLFVISLVIFTTFRVPALAMLGYWIVVQLIGGFTSVGATGGGVAFLGSRRRFCVRSNFGVSF